MMIEIKIKLNGKDTMIQAEPHSRVLDLLREKLHLTGTKEGCGEGECGACSVLLNGEVVNSCLILLGQLKDGDHVETIEGLSQGKKFSVLQKHFVSGGAMQCGICSPGMMMAAESLLRKNKRPTREEITEAISGNLCRCTGYVKIIDAIENAAREMKS
ncbi:MAG: (2Fe-2S)-binding protein [Pseudomonadota bacterium]